MKNQNAQVEIDLEDKPLPLWFILTIPFYVGGLLALIIFPIARDWGWFEGWTFLITFLINITVSYYLINKENPRVIRNRMKVKKVGLTALTRKSAGSDKFVLPFLGLGFYGALIVPGFDFRFGWTSIPLAIEMLGLAIANIGLIIMDIAMLQNAFASKLLDINKGQSLIDSGLYAHVRHPLYSGAILMALALPIALGSLWGLIPAIIACLSLVIRIKFEEDMLEKGMGGYPDYQTRVKYKLLPGIY